MLMPDDAYVLVIEDDANNLIVAMDFLQMLGVRYANSRASGWQGLKLAESLPQLDLILLDIQLPHEDGYAVLQQIRNNPKFRDTRGGGGDGQRAATRRGASHGQPASTALSASHSTSTASRIRFGHPTRRTHLDGALTGSRRAVRQHSFRICCYLGPLVYRRLRVSITRRSPRW